MIDLSILQTESDAVYHGKKLEYLSSHQLLDFKKCPLLHHLKRHGRIQDTDSAAYTLGRAAHCRILEGKQAYQSRYMTGGPINPKTGQPFGAATKAFAEWAAEQTKEVLTQEQAYIIDAMYMGVTTNEHAADLLLFGQPEGVVRVDYRGTPCQIRIDFLNPASGIVDLKTCDDLTYFESDARRYGYISQMAFYRAVLAEVLNGEKVPIHIIAVEKREPFRCGVWNISTEGLNFAEHENAAAIRELLQCRESGIWPTGYEAVRTLHSAV